MDRQADDLRWLVNIETIIEQFQQVPFFNEGLRYNKKHAYHLVGGNSNQYAFEQYRKVFPKISDENVVLVKDAGHWVHFDKPAETTDLLS
jgi:pimeloyl-ACP methyl ester carboxylesterase